MIKPPINELLKKVENTYALCVIVSKRSEELIDGAQPLTECNSKRPVSIAVNELYEGKITYTQAEGGQNKK